jgi:hypothetical protein
VNLPVTPDALARLPSELAWVEKEYAPSGPVTLTHTYRKGAPGRETGATKRWTIQPLGMHGVCSLFPYPLEQVKGTIDVELVRCQGKHGQRDIDLDLAGVAGNRPVTIKGKVYGPREHCGVHVDIRGEDLLLDDSMYRALASLRGAVDVASQFMPEESRQLGLHERPMGKADIHAALRRPPGQRESEHVFTIRFHDTRVKYNQFPYPLEDVSGTLVIHPDHW